MTELHRPDGSFPPVPAWGGAPPAAADQTDAAAWGSPYGSPGPHEAGSPFAQPRRRLTGGLVVGGLLGFLAGAATVVALIFVLGATGMFDPEPTAYGPGSSVEQFALAVGACGDGLPEEGGSWPAEEQVACDGEHDFEVYAAAPLPAAAGETYPSSGALAYYADGLCELAFEPFVGVDYLDSALFYTALVPGEAAWGVGDREVVCVLFDPAERMVGSARHSGW